MDEPSFLAETCTPSSFWPEAEVIEPVSNWSAEAVLAAPTRTRPAALANSWHRKFVIVFLSSSHGCSASASRSQPSPRMSGEGGEGARDGLAQSTDAERRARPRPIAGILRTTARFPKKA